MSSWGWEAAPTAPVRAGACLILSAHPGSARPSSAHAGQLRRWSGKDGRPYGALCERTEAPTFATCFRAALACARRLRSTSRIACHPSSSAASADSSKPEKGAAAFAASTLDVFASLDTCARSNAATMTRRKRCRTTCRQRKDHSARGIETIQTHSQAQQRALASRPLQHKHPLTTCFLAARCSRFTASSTPSRDFSSPIARKRHAPDT